MYSLDGVFMSLSVEEVILKKAKEDAEKIIDIAKLEASKIIAEATKKKEEIILKEKEKVLREVNIGGKIAEARMKIRQRICETKNSIMYMIEENVKNLLNSMDMSKRMRSLENLITEALDELLSNVSTKKCKIVIYVSKNDREILELILPSLKQRYRWLELEVKEVNISGGVIVEDIERGITIDNSYESRLRKALILYTTEFKRLFE